MVGDRIVVRNTQADKIFRGLFEVAADGETPTRPVAAASALATSADGQHYLVQVLPLKRERSLPRDVAATVLLVQKGRDGALARARRHCCGLQAGRRVRIARADGHRRGRRRSRYRGKARHCRDHGEERIPSVACSRRPVPAGQADLVKDRGRPSYPRRLYSNEPRRRHHVVHLTARAAAAM